LVEPAVATVLGVAVLGERLLALSWAGLVVLAAGLAILTFPKDIARRFSRPASSPSSSQATTPGTMKR
jgi:drug/metabolite transporter (DMT)-like permease